MVCITAVSLVGFDTVFTGQHTRTLPIPGQCNEGGNMCHTVNTHFNMDILYFRSWLNKSTCFQLYLPQHLMRFLTSVVITL